MDAEFGQTPQGFVVNMSNSFRIESLLAARLFLSPQLASNRLYFISDLSGRLSLYVMDEGGSVPEPLLPPDLALQNPALVEGESFFVFPKIGKVLVMIDRDGDENYQPMFIPLEGGIPGPVFGDRFQGQQVLISHADSEHNLAAFQVDPRTSPLAQTYLANLETRELVDLGSSLYLNRFAGHDGDYSRVALFDEYTAGDHVLYLWEREAGKRRLLCGQPLEDRREGEVVHLNSIDHCYFTSSGSGLLFFTSLFDDQYGIGYIALDGPQAPRPVEINGTLHSGLAELEPKRALKHLCENRYLLIYNVDGCTFAYEAIFDEAALTLRVERPLLGTGRLRQGVLQHIAYEKPGARYALSFSTATSPSQLYTVRDGQVEQLTHERILGIPQYLLAMGEDASFTSYDGLPTPARLYLPSPHLGFEGKRPVIFYVHGGPQSQERPDFTWFSMPLIQFFTLHGLAVFVPNVRGSSGYGLKYMKRVDHDWGGQDRLDHVAAFEHLREDARLDLDRAGVMGRSYGGFMTLTLAGRHPGLWKAACDMFGPYNLFTFMERLPETWKTYMYMAVGHPEKEREFLVERSPSTYLKDLNCPLLVIQGHNDPRVVEAESRDLVEQLRAEGKTIEFLVFANEGHDVLKFENKVHCYNEITRFFVKYLMPE
jgi:pimeloyl-ACP methyl ester carboxylesterase